MERASKFNYLKKFLIKRWVSIIALLLVVLSFLPVFVYLYSRGTQDLSPIFQEWGVFGDYIGGVSGTILSFLSIFLIYVTYTNQVRISTLQQFEATFFSLLQNQREILKSLSGNFSYLDTVDSYTKQGNEYISEISDRIANLFDKPKKILFYNDFQGDNDSEKIDSIESIVDKAYNAVYMGQEAELGHYFRHLYHIIKYVDEGQLENDKKKKYIDIIQAQMSDDELYVTFYNCIAIYGRVRFRPLVEKYQFFENIRSRGKLFDKHKNIFYPKTKFKYNSID